MKKLMFLILIICLTNNLSINGAQEFGLINEDYSESKEIAECNVLHKQKTNFAILNRRYPRETRGLFKALHNESLNFPKEIDKLIIEYCESYDFEEILGDEEKINGAIQLRDGAIATYSLNKIKLWYQNPGDFECVQILNGHTNLINSLIQLKNGDLASCADDTTIIIWHQNPDLTWTIRSLTDHTEWVNSIIQFKNGDLGSCSSDNTLRIWHLDPKNSWFKTYHGPASFTFMIQLKNGDLITAARNKTITLWHKNFNDSWNIICFNLPNCVESIIQLQNGDLAVRFWMDKTIKIWRLNPRNLFEHIETLKGHEDHINSLIQINNGDLISCSDKTIKIWRQNSQHSFVCVQTLNEKESCSALFKLNNDDFACCVGNQVKTFIKPFANLFKTSKRVKNLTSDSHDLRKVDPGSVNLDVQNDFNTSSNSLMMILNKLFEKCCFNRKEDDE